MRAAGEDLEALERVLDTLLPANFWQEYREDIRHLRKRGLPEDLPAMPTKRSGGVPVAEQTTRMRAAVAYVSTVSKTPFGDLARFWNERLREEKYRAESMRDRLRRGPASERGDGASRRWLEYWRQVYDGDLRRVFPGPFPLSPKMKERHRRS